jgi:spore germination cell wall hydrolase CwlJ-like protein
MTWAMDVAARTLWQEVRGEPAEGQVAVAHVIKNRLESGRWGRNLATVCLWRGQFSGWFSPADPNFAGVCLLPDNDPELMKMWQVMHEVMQSWTDPTNGATHYCNLGIVHPGWIKDATHCGKFGNHTFFKDVK